MNHKDLVTRVAARVGITHVDAHIVINGIVEEIFHSLAAGHIITLPRIATFKVKYRPTRPGRNPRTNQKTVVPGHPYPHCTISEHIKAEVKARCKLFEGQE